MVLNDAWNVEPAEIVWTVSVNACYVVFAVIAVNYVKDVEATAA